MNDQHHIDDQHAPPIHKLPSVPLQPVVGTPRSDEACEDAEVWASRNPKGPVVPYRLAARMERELHHALCSIRELLNDGMHVQNLNNGEVDVFHADVDGIAKFLEEASAEEYAARISSNQKLTLDAPSASVRSEEAP